MPTQQLRRKAVVERVGPANKRFRVDAGAGIIYNCRIVGTESKNRRRYPIDVLRRRFALYEGQHVYGDHAPGKRGARSMKEWAGVTRECRIEDDGVYGNVHVITSSPAGRMLLEAAIKCPDSFGLSPYHFIDFVRESDGTELVVDIAEVVSVDVVTRPATNKSLYEEIHVATEQDTGAAMAPAVMGIEEALAQLQAAITGSADHDDNEKMAMWKDLLKFKAKLLGTDDEPADEPADAAAAGAGEAVQARSKGKGRLSRLEQDMREMRIERIAERAGVQLTATQLETLAGLSTAAVYEEIDAMKKQQRRPYGTGAPRSSARAEAPSTPARKAPPMLTRGAAREDVQRHYRN